MCAWVVAGNSFEHTRDGHTAFLFSLIFNVLLGPEGAGPEQCVWSYSVEDTALSILSKF
jgi:hypothetical protein